MGLIFNAGISDEQLQELFSDDEKCLGFLAHLKWQDGFVCRKCGNDNFCSGKALFSRRCTKCKTVESATTGTIFHNCKFPLHKAFYIAYNVCKGENSISSYEFARRLSLRQMTCWNFKTKISEALSQMDSLTKNQKAAMLKMLSGEKL